jgi:hypothetical protein
MSQLYRCDRFASPLTTARILDVSAGPKVNAVGAFIVKVPDNVPVVKPTCYADLLTQRALGYLQIFSAFPRVMFDDFLDASAVDMAHSSGVMLGNPGEAVLLPGGILQSQTVSLGLAVLQGTFNVTYNSVNVPTTADQTSVLSGGGTVVFSSQPSVQYTIAVSGVHTDHITLTGEYTGTTDAETLAYSGLASNPVQALITWDTFSNSDLDPKDGQFSRQYTEEASVSGNITASVSFDGGSTWNAALDGVVFDVPLVDRGTSFIIKLTNVSGRRLSLSGWNLLF